MERLDAGQPPLILGDGSQTMDFVYVDDVARANVLALSSDVSDESCNVGTGVETSLTQLAAVLSHVMGVRVVSRAWAGAKGRNAVTRRLASTEKAQRLLGFRASVMLEEGLSRLVTGGGRSASGCPPSVDHSRRSAVARRARRRGGQAGHPLGMGDPRPGGCGVRARVRGRRRRPYVRGLQLHHRAAPRARGAGCRSR